MSPGETAVSRVAASDGTQSRSAVEFDTALAYCRLASTQAQDRSSKPGKESLCLSQILVAPLDTLPARGDVNLVDLGCGNGEKALQIIRSLRAHNIGRVRYFPVDRNRHSGLFAVITVLRGDRPIDHAEATALFGCPPPRSFLEALSARPFPYEAIIAAISANPPAIAHICREALIVPTRGQVLDFVRDIDALTGLHSELAERAGEITVFCLLGQTLGNYGAAERAILLSGLRRRMRSTDLLLVDGGLRPEESHRRADDVATRTANLVDFYRLGERFMRPEADCAESLYRVAYDADAHRVDYWFERPDGTRQDLGFSNMWSGRSFHRELASAGFEIRRSASSVDFPELGSGPESIAVVAQTGRGR